MAACRMVPSKVGGAGGASLSPQHEGKWSWHQGHLTWQYLAAVDNWIHTVIKHENEDK